MTEPGGVDNPADMGLDSAARSRVGSSRSAVPASARVSPQLNALCQRAANGAVEDIKRLAKWSALVDHEAQMLRWRLRKQQHDFATLFEIVGQTSARALEVESMQTYLLRTVSGHFATPRVMIMRRMRAEDGEVICSACQGVVKTRLALPLSSNICQHALQCRYCFFLKEAGEDAEEVKALRALGVDLAVPLVQEVEGPGAVLEGIILLGARLSGREYSDEDIEFLHILGKLLAICLRNEALYRRSIIDDLTGVASRGHFDAQLNQELNRITAYGHRGLGLVMLDVDKFKNFNDTYGHQTGDRILQELAKVLVDQVRNVDLVARYGGEEFAIILLEIDRSVVLEVANRLRMAVESMQVLSPQGEKLRVTASFGIACFPGDATEKHALIQLADEALYRSKENGRNRVTIAEPGAGLNREPLPRPESKLSTDRAPKNKRRNHAVVLGMSSPEIEQIQREQNAIAAEIDGQEESLRTVERRRGLKA